MDLLAMFFTWREVFVRSRPALPGADHFPRAAVRGWGCEGLMFSFLTGGSTFLTDSPKLKSAGGI